MKVKASAVKEIAMAGSLAVVGFKALSLFGGINVFALARSMAPQLAVLAAAFVILYFFTE